MQKILDIREQHEYESGHIPGAVLLRVGSIDADTAAAVIPEKDAIVLVYCRSGNRSKTASATLVELDYRTRGHHSMSSCFLITCRKRGSYSTRSYD